MAADYGLLIKFRLCFGIASTFMEKNSKMLLILVVLLQSPNLLMHISKLMLDTWRMHFRVLMHMTSLQLEGHSKRSPILPRTMNRFKELTATEKSNDNGKCTSTCNRLEEALTLLILFLAECARVVMAGYLLAYSCSYTKTDISYIADTPLTPSLHTSWSWEMRRGLMDLSHDIVCPHENSVCSVHCEVAAS